MVSPRDALELWLTQCCEELLSREALGVRHALRGLGMTAVTAALLRTRIQERFSSEVRLPRPLEEASIEQLAMSLRPHASALLHHPLVALQPRGSKPPLFVIPGGDGIAFNFLSLARRMGPDQPCHAFQARGMYGELPPHERVEDMAAAYIEAMRALQPHGPYQLVGHCFGGSVAFEMALQLRAQGQRVSLLALVETLDPTALGQKDFSRFHNDTTGGAFLQMLTRGVESWSGRPLGLTVEALQALPPAELWSDVLGRLQQHGTLAPDTGIERLHSIRRIFMNAVHNNYVPREAWPERITFIRGDTSKFCEGAIRGGWDKHSPVPVEAHTVPGDHVTIFTEPHVEVLGRTLRTFLERT